MSKIKTGEWFLAIVAFSNPTTAPDGSPDLRLDMRILNPDGSPAGGFSDVPGYSGPPFPAEAKNKLELTTKYLVFRASPSDPLGTYQVEAALHDRLSGKSLSLARTVRVVSAAE